MLLTTTAPTPLLTVANGTEPPPLSIATNSKAADTVINCY